MCTDRKSKIQHKRGSLEVQKGLTILRAQDLMLLTPLIFLELKSKFLSIFYVLHIFSRAKDIARSKTFLCVTPDRKLFQNQWFIRGTCFWVSCTNSWAAMMMLSWIWVWKEHSMLKLSVDICNHFSTARDGTSVPRAAHKNNPFTSGTFMGLRDHSETSVKELLPC